MLPQRIQSEIQSIDSKVKQIEARIDSEELLFQSIFAQHLVLAASGLIEKATIEILCDYSDKRGNKKIMNFIRKAVSYNNSLNCEKLKIILEQFDREWWRELTEASTVPQRSAIDSLKTLRDQSAHGQFNGTGFSTVKQYYVHTKEFLKKLAEIIDGTP